ncbi:hypothetical protein ZIOFF_062974 [Zingiber officinale]|uniref:Chromo domain-containing protein n=1 Tax=Zingiber officinale TaxID=94328 RepID=A0A8J5F1K3_ZINOF|nr:hypothetical protein ZIOFF_062974 [Zingiber officinale]
MYGRSPPRLSSYLVCTSHIESVDQELQTREQLLKNLRGNLFAAQNHLKLQYDSSHREVRFEIGDMMLSKLQSYRQVSLASKNHSKLSPHFYGLFKIIDRVGHVAYKLQLSDHVKIHLVFHVSSLKKYHGSIPSVPTLPPINQEDYIPSPLVVLDYRSHRGHSQILVHWEGLSPVEASWEYAVAIMELMDDFFSNFDVLTKMALFSLVHTLVYLILSKFSTNFSDDKVTRSLSFRPTHSVSVRRWLALLSDMPAGGKEQEAAAKGNGVTFFLSGSSSAPTPATGRSISSSPSPACDFATGATHRRSSSSASRRRHHPPPPPHCDSTAGHAAAGECFLLRFSTSAANREERGVSSSLSRSSQVARPAAGLRPLLFSSSPLPVVGIASVLLEMLPSELPQFAGAAAGRPSHYSLFSSLHRRRRTTAAFSRNRCHLPQGKVKVYPEGHGNEFVEIEAGDLVEFPKGMKCTWDVSVAIDKHYNFE